MKSRIVWIVGLVVLGLGSLAACKQSDNTNSGSNDVVQRPYTQNRVVGTRHEIGCAGMRRCY